MTIEVLNRSDWGADLTLPALGYSVPVEQFRGLVVHHTVMVLPDTDHDGYAAGDLDDIVAYMQRLQRARPDLGLDVPYSFSVFEGATPRDAVIGVGRGQFRTGAHTAGFNSSRWGVAIAGDCTYLAPTAGMLEAIRLIGRWLADPEHAEPTLGHFETGYATACPGELAKPFLPVLQPPFTSLDQPEIEDPMPEYVVMLESNAFAPWIAVYATGMTRHIGTGEWKTISAMKAIPVVVETDPDAHKRLIRLSGSQWPTNEQ